MGNGCLASVGIRIEVSHCTRTHTALISLWNCSNLLGIDALTLCLKASQDQAVIEVDCRKKVDDLLHGNIVEDPSNVKPELERNQLPVLPSVLHVSHQNHCRPVDSVHIFRLLNAVPSITCFVKLGQMSDAEEPEKKPRGMSTEECQRMVDKAVTRDPVVKFMLEKLDEVS